MITFLIAIVALVYLAVLIMFITAFVIEFHKEIEMSNKIFLLLSIPAWLILLFITLFKIEF